MKLCLVLLLPAYIQTFSPLMFTRGAPRQAFHLSIQERSTHLSSEPAKDLGLDPILADALNSLDSLSLSLNTQINGDADDAYDAEDCDDSDDQADLGVRAVTEAKEWEIIMSAFHMYKAAFGDLKVPSRFVVPELQPWPAPTHNLKLGQKVAMIRSTGRYTVDHEERRRQLDELGFVWRVRNAPFDSDGIEPAQIILALKTYKAVHDDMEVPPSFRVPNCDPWPVETRGLPLGMKVAAMRTKSFLKAMPQYEEELVNLGFELDPKAAANAHRFSKVYDALSAYKKKNGNLLVPQPFVVPENDVEFPEETWGLRLGARVNAIRSQGTFVKFDQARREMLEDLGFTWELTTNASGKKRGRKKTLEEEDAVADVSSGPQFSDKFGLGDGIVLGDLVTLPPPPVPTQMEPVWGTAQPSPLEFAASTFGEASVAEILQVEEELRAAEAAAQGLGEFVFDEFCGFLFEDVLEALTVWKEHTGEFDIPLKYIIGQEEIVEEALGGGDDDDSVARLIAALELEESAGGVGDFSEDTVVGGEMGGSGIEGIMAKALGKGGEGGLGGVLFDERLNGMPLGDICAGIKCGNLGCKGEKDQKKALDQIMFDWVAPDKFIPVPFAKTLTGLYAYKKIRGDLTVDYDFEIPSHEPWPKSLIGMPLGLYVDKIRKQKQLYLDFYPEKMRMLSNLDFIFML